MATQRVENVKPHILRQCREQIGLSIAQAQKKAGLKTLEKIEQGETKPTFNQLEKLAERYHVPQWVFLRRNFLTNTILLNLFLLSGILLMKVLFLMITKLDQLRPM